MPVSSFRRSRRRHQHSTKNGGPNVKTAKIAIRVGLSRSLSLFSTTPEMGPKAPAPAA